MPRPIVEEKKKNLNVYIEPTKVNFLGQRTTAKHCRDFAEFINKPENLKKWNMLKSQI